MKKIFIILLTSYNMTICQQFDYIISYSAGLNDVHIRDEQISPYIFRGGIFNNELKFNVTKPETKHEIAIKFSQGKLSSDNKYIDYYSFSNVMVRYGLSKKILEKHSGKIAVDAYAGGNLNMYFTISEFMIYGSYIGESVHHWGWFNRNSFELKLNPVLKYNNYKLNITIAYPLLSIISRPEYSILQNYYPNDNLGYILSDMFRGRMQYFWDMISLNSEIEMNYEANSRVNIFLKYGFDYNSSDYRNRIRSFINQFNFGIKIKL